MKTFLSLIIIWLAATWLLASTAAIVAFLALAAYSENKSINQ